MSTWNCPACGGENDTARHWCRTCEQRRPTTWSEILLWVFTVGGLCLVLFVAIPGALQHDQAPDPPMRRTPVVAGPGGRVGLEQAVPNDLPYRATAGGGSQAVMMMGGTDGQWAVPGDRLPPGLGTTWRPSREELYGYRTRGERVGPPATTP